MAHAIEGNDVIGYRVVDDEVGALTGRLRTAEEARSVAGVDSKPAAAKSAPAKKAPAKSGVNAVTTADISAKPDES